MTAQQQTQQVKKLTTWFKANTVAMFVFTGVIVWYSTYQVKLYNAYVLQPQKDLSQDERINGLQKSVGDKTVDIEMNKKIIGVHDRKIAVINAIFPQTQIDTK